ncbi:hypothetical protein BJ742DRAFT_857548 [Cladochytrium replicatum]|nr:hypothetical protein BJ742DRAFT_857548 [Cladochytrium replicatum]
MASPTFPLDLVGDFGWGRQDTVTRLGDIVAFGRVAPVDEPGLARFHTALSTRSVTQRCFDPHTLEPRISHKRLARICHRDHDRLVRMGTHGHEGEIKGAPEAP